MGIGISILLTFISLQIVLHFKKTHPKWPPSSQNGVLLNKDLAPWVVLQKLWRFEETLDEQNSNQNPNPRWGLARRKVLPFSGRRAHWFSAEGERPETPWYLTFWALIDPMIDQDENLMRHEEGHRARFILGIWYLALIVLGCAYKSALINFLVLPAFDEGPRTFEELAQSDYKIGTLFWTDVIREHFVDRGDSNSLKILERAKEYPYFNNEVREAFL
jgi:hypothetical protein